MPYQRAIFLSAALFNWLVGGALLLAFPLMQNLLAIAPAADSVRVFVDLFAVVVCSFGVAYYLLARDFASYRPYAGLGAGAKLAVAAVTVGHFLAGDSSWQLAALSSADLLYAILFIAILRRKNTRSSRS